MNLLIGIDIGTTRAKGGVYNENGRLLARAETSYPMTTERFPASVDEDPLDWWSAVQKIGKQLMSNYQSENIKGIAVGSQGPSLVILDKYGQPIRDSLIWMDHRALQEAKELSSNLGQDIDPMMIIPKLLWLKKHEPDNFNRIAWAFQPLDYINYQLTGEIIASLASDDLRLWTDDVLKVSGIHKEIFPPVYKMGKVVGTVTKKASRETSFPIGVPVFSGTGGADFIETLIGTNTLQPGRICDRGGTSQGVDFCWPKAITAGGLFCIPHPIIQGQYHIGGLMTTTGKALQWYKECFFPKEISYETILKEAKYSPPGARKLIFLPYLAGERTPWWDTEARGVFLGLSTIHERKDLLRAVLEGVALGIGQIINLIRAGGGKPVEIRACGGQAQSPLWNQIKADVTGIPVLIPENTEISTLGMAIIAGWGAGVYENLVQAANHLVKITRVFEPQNDNHNLYQELLEVYETLYPALKDSFHRMGQIDIPG